MTTLPLADGARMLGIHPKTFHHWLRQAQMSLHPHPTDARLKCVTLEHVQQLASIHARPLPSPTTVAPALPAGPPAPASSLGQALPWQESARMPIPDPGSLPPSFPQEAELLQKLSCLETRVATLSDQLAQLALSLLQERDRTLERRVSALEAVVPPAVAGLHCSPPLPLPEFTQAGNERSEVARPKRSLNPAEQRARSRLSALIEYSAAGTYVIISSQEGELHLVPESREWFEWLASLSSFRFVGQQGRFTAYRHDRLSRSWRAHRVIHQRSYKQTLGVTEQLTLHRFELVAATLQSHMASL
jgi:hypothetical protein